VHAGDTEAVHERTLRAVHRQQLVEVQGQTDVLVMGVPYLGPYNVNSVMNPVLATCSGLGYYFNSYRGQPLVRRGGAVIIYHPVPEVFSTLHHPSYVDFYEEVLAESTDPATIESKFEAAYANDPWYVHLYRRRMPTTGCTRSTCGTGRRTPWTTWRTSCGWAPTGTTVQRMGYSAPRARLAGRAGDGVGTSGAPRQISYLHNPPAPARRRR
jgi:hypothetical protein